VLYGNTNAEVYFQKGAWVVIPMIPFPSVGAVQANLCLVHWGPSSYSLEYQIVPNCKLLIFNYAKMWMVLFLYCYKIALQKRKTMKKQQQVCTKSKTKTTSHTKKPVKLKMPKSYMP